jgi:hypothetical protein
VTWTTRECNWQSSKANPIFSDTTDCPQSTDYLYTNEMLIWTALSCECHKMQSWGNPTSKMGYFVPIYVEVIRWVIRILSHFENLTVNNGRNRDYTFVIIGAETGMLRMTRVPFPGWLAISTLPP